MVSMGEVEHVLMSVPGAALGDIMRADTVPAIRRFLTGNATTTPYLTAWLNLDERLCFGTTAPRSMCTILPGEAALRSCHAPVRTRTGSSATGYPAAPKVSAIVRLVSK